MFKETTNRFNYEFDSGLFLDHPAYIPMDQKSKPIGCLYRIKFVSKIMFA